MVGRVQPDGSVTRVASHRLGAIGDGHHAKLSSLRGFTTTAWDFTFEQDFDDADSRFPEVISWLENLPHSAAADRAGQSLFRAQAATDDQLRALTECVVSLVIRSPMNRETFAELPGRFGFPATNVDRNAAVTVNMRGKQRTVADSIGASGKFAILYAEHREFICGDGCFNNLNGAVDPPHYPKLVVPITPVIAVIVCRPMSYMVEPRLSSIVLTDELVDHCNQAIQIYSRAELFFRTELPRLDSAFTSGERQRYAHPDNPIDALIRAIPGITDRDRSLDALFELRN